MSAHHTAFVATMIFGALSLASAQHARADCTYTIKGNVEVAHQLSELQSTLGAESPLENIQVKVSAQKKVGFVWGWFSEWETVRTDADGAFSVTKTKNCAKRRFRVKVKFDDDELELRHETSTSSLTKVKWYTVYDDSGDVYRDSVTVNLGDLTFESGGNDDLGEFEPRRHADIWVLYHMAFDQMADYGHPFEDKIKLKYPHDGVAPDLPEASYANPLNNVIYIVKNSGSDAGDDTDTLLHELMHMWLYQHSRGEDAMAGYLVTHLQRGTHDIVDQEYVAFHEGFAEYSMHVLVEDLFGIERPLPLSRTTLAGQGLDTLEMMQFKDTGWESTFLLIALEHLDDYDFSSTGYRIDERGFGLAQTCDEVTQIGFKRLLRIFAADDDAGYSQQIHRDEMNYDDFFTRAQDILSKYDAADEDVHLQLLDPESDFEPYEDICEPWIIGPGSGWLSF
ncbi:MAG: hypothetical protein ACE366_22760 [Bradymonadia bacterium]